MGEYNMTDIALGVAIGAAGFLVGRSSGKKLGKKQAEKANGTIKNGGKKQNEKEKKDKKRHSHHGGYKPLPSQPLQRHHSVTSHRPPTTTTTTTTVYSQHPAKPVSQPQLPPHAAPRPVPVGQGLHLQTAPHWNQHEYSRASSRAPPTQMQVRGPEPYHPSYYY